MKNGINLRPGTNLPHFKCHKVVRAAKIADMLVRIGSDAVRLEFDGIPGAVEVSRDWMHRTEAEIGGYFVLYEDGYASYSPAKAFEEGYTQLTGEELVAISIGAVRPSQTFLAAGAVMDWGDVEPGP